MALDRFPALNGLMADLTKLSVEEAARRRAARGDPEGEEAIRVSEGRDVTAVTIPWLGRRYLLTGAQREVVRQLLHAYLHCKNPEMDEPTLLARAGVKGHRRLSQLFEGSPAWGELVVRGKGVACYRLAPPPDGFDQGDQGGGEEE